MARIKHHACVVVLRFDTRVISRAALTLCAALTFSGEARAQDCGADLLTVIPGDIPVILTAPHAGDADKRIPGVPTRSCAACTACLAAGAASWTVGGDTRSCASCSSCNTGRDVHTDVVTDGIAAELLRLTGGQPYVVMAHFDRKFLDTNRPDAWSAYEDVADAGPCYQAYHDAVRNFVDEVRTKYGAQGLLVDIHGQGIYRCAGGANAGRQCTPGAGSCGAGSCTDETLRDSICRGTRDGQTVTALRARHGAQAITGPNSVMGQIAALGWSVYPPAGTLGAPLEGGATGCFNGGHTVATYGSHQPDGLDAIQLEFGRNLRDDRAGRAAMSADVGRAIATFYEAFLSDAIRQLHAGAREESGDGYGDALATGDFNGDGRPDLAVGLPGETDAARDEGMVIVHFAGGSTERIVQRHAGATGEVGDGFGAVLAAADFDRDGYDDLAIGVPAEDDRARDDGTVVVLYGSSQGLLTRIGSRTAAVRAERLSQTHTGASSEAYDRFGTTLTTGDFDDDGYDDLAVGVPAESIGAADEGMVVVFFGARVGLLTTRGGATVATRYERIVQSHAGATGQAYDRFGAALSRGDYDGDGFDDLAVGVPGEDHDGVSNNGLVVVLYGSSAGLLVNTPYGSTAGRYERIDQGHAGASEESGDGFGAALASGDFNRDGEDDLAVGMPDEDVGGTNAGMVIVYYGSRSGLLVQRSGRTVAAGYARLTQSRAGGTNEAYDRFGAALAAGDFDNDGEDDLAVGTPGENSFGVSDVGMVVLFYGDRRGILASGRTRRVGQSVRGVDERGDQLGKRLCTGDLDGDGRDEIIIGVPDEDFLDLSGAGAVYSVDG